MANCLQQLRNSSNIGRNKEHFSEILGRTDANNNENVELLGAKTLPIKCDVPTRGTHH